MEASPFGFAPERHWTEEKERTLISYFAKHSCLWNHKSESYKNRQLRWKTLEHLRMLLSTHPPPAPFTVEDIKNKFKNLRTTFQRQYKLVKASKVCGSDDVFVPQWKHYQQLMFLQGSRDLDDDMDVPPLSPVPVQQEESQPLLSSPGLVISFLPAAANTPSSSSSCLPPNMPAKCFWTEDKERALIDFYCEHSCLWNKKSENHNNRQLRLRLLETLRSQLSDQTATFSVDDIKCKFKNLRTVFNREYKAVQASRASDKVYQSKWKHYQKLLFLCECCGDEEDALDELHMLLPQEDKDPEHGNQTPSSTLSSLSSSSAQTGRFPSMSSPPGCAHIDVKPPAASYHIFLDASPDNVKLEGHKAPGSASPSPSPLDNKPSANPTALNFSASGPVHPDSRLMADPRCHWTDAKVQQLISFYSKHGCLWNHKSESYRNRLLRHSLLESLSRLLSDKEPLLFTVEDIKTKFRNLRTIFQREHKAVSSNKICGSEDFYLPKWKHYRELMFLCDSCDEDERPDEPRFHQPRECGLLRLEGHNPPPPLHYQTSLAAAYQAADKPKSVMQPLEAPPSPTPPDSQRSSPLSTTSTVSSHTDSRVSGRKRTSRRAAAAAAAATAAATAAASSGQMLDLMRTLCQSQVTSPHAGFLKYVEECLNETPPDKVKRLKKMIIDTIHSTSEEA